MCSDSFIKFSWCALNSISGSKIIDLIDWRDLAFHLNVNVCVCSFVCFAKPPAFHVGAYVRKKHCAPYNKANIQWIFRTACKSKPYNDIDSTENVYVLFIYSSSFRFFYCCFFLLWLLFSSFFMIIGTMKSISCDLSICGISSIRSSK